MDLTPKTTASMLTEVAARLSRSHPSVAKALAAAGRYVVTLTDPSAKPARGRTGSKASASKSTGGSRTIRNRPTSRKEMADAGRVSKVPAQAREGVSAVRYVDQATRGELLEIAAVLEALGEATADVKDPKRLQAALGGLAGVARELRDRVS